MTEELRFVPLLPLRGLLVFPSMVLHLDVGREMSMNALEHAMVGDEHIVLAAQKESQTDQPKFEDIYHTGTLAKIKQMLKLPNGTVRVLVEGICRVKLHDVVELETHHEVQIEELYDTTERDVELEALMRTALQYFEQYVKMSNKISSETYTSVIDITEPGRLADIISSHLPLKMKDKQLILEEFDLVARLNRVISVIYNEKEVLELERQIDIRVKKSIEKTQKEYYLREQMKAIQKELGDKEGKTGEVQQLLEKIEAANMPEHILETAMKELERYEKMPQNAAESAVIRNYLDWLISLPWSNATQDVLDIGRSEQVLNDEHYGLEKVKERILEFLAVRQLTNSLKGPILCLVGPPGVGKTSLARSVATALERNFVRMSLGGVRDESEIRGHRRTYVGAMPGRIIQGMKKAGTINPVFLLDEIDKMSSDFRGDPSSALLEVLDPEQNSTFSDHYIEETYDLSNVLFIATANSLATIPGPLLDRMEVISIAGYTEQEKTAIAEQHLLPKQMKAHGLMKKHMQVKQESLLDVIRYYTREAGVRNLERTLATVCRKAAKMIVSGEKKKVVVTPALVETMLGRHKFRYGRAELDDQIGVATGLAYTTVGGDTLAIEVSLYPGKGKLILTGKLGDVMKESAQAAFSYIRSRAKELHIDENFHDKHDIHIHVPEGAVPKDGPSAGITMATALISALTGRAVRKEVGMTGEITLRGRVLPIGGVKEKTLSAHRAGLTTIILPQDNEKDVDDIPTSVREQLTFHYVSNLDEVLQYALLGDTK